MARVAARADSSLASFRLRSRAREWVMFESVMAADLVAGRAWWGNRSGGGDHRLGLTRLTASRPAASCSIARILPTRRTCRGAPLKVAARKLSAHETAVSLARKSAGE